MPLPERGEEELDFIFYNMRGVLRINLTESTSFSGHRGFEKAFYFQQSYKRLGWAESTIESSQERDNLVTIGELDVALF